MKLLDSDHCIAILRQKLDLGKYVQADEPLATTVISVAELTYGACRSQKSEDNLARLEVLLSALIVFPFDEHSARRFGILKASLESRGEKLDDFDLQIASIAIENNLLLLTNHGQHFHRIKELQIGNWLAENGQVNA